LDYHTASLGRSTRGGGVSVRPTHFPRSPVSDSDQEAAADGIWRSIIPSSPQQQKQQQQHQQQQQQQLHNLGKSSNMRGPSRRYGSIRVAECSFIEHPESRIISPVCDSRRPPMPPPKRPSYVAKPRRQTITQINYVPSPFDRFQPVSDEDSPDEREREAYLNVYSQRNVQNLGNTVWFNLFYTFF
jgi:hypothetical protein